MKADKDSSVKSTYILINSVGLSIAVWNFLYPNPYILLLGSAILFPVVVFITYRFNKSISLDLTRLKEFDSTVIYGIAFPVIALVIRVMMDINIYDQLAVLVPVSIITLILILFLFLGNKEMELLSTNGLLALVLVVIYSYCTAILINCNFDRSNPQVLTAKVLKKWKSNRKNTIFYYAELSPWGNRNKAEAIAISKELFEAQKDQQQIGIYVYKGNLNIPWFVVGSGNKELKANE